MKVEIKVGESLFNYTNILFNIHAYINNVTSGNVTERD